MNETQYINYCLLEVEKKLGWRSHENWTNSDFQKLAKYIYEASGISISSHTLKRLYGKVRYKKTYNPQEATRDALAKFLDYNSWDQFVEATRDSIEKKQVQDFPRQNIKKRKKRNILIITWLLIILLLGSFTWLFVIDNSIKSVRAKLTVRNPSGIVPHTVTFDFNVYGIQTKDLFIDYDFVHPYLGGKYVIVNNSDSIINYTYQVPGVFHPTLKKENKILDSSIVIAKTKGWASFYQDEKNKDLYWLSNMVNNLELEGILTYTREDIIKYGGDTLGIYFTTHRNIRNFGVSGDNFILESRVKNGPENGGFTCYDINVTIYGKRSNSFLRLVEKNCQSYCLLKFGEISLTGRLNELDFLSQDLSKWTNLRIEVINKNVKLYINEEKVYSGSYKENTGEILGLEFRFKGSGMADYVILKDIDDEVAYRDDFN